MCVCVCEGERECVRERGGDRVCACEKERDRANEEEGECVSVDASGYVCMYV